MRQAGSTKSSTRTDPRRPRRGEKATQRRRPHPPALVNQTTALPVAQARPLLALTGGRANAAERAEIDQLTHSDRITAMQHGQFSLRQLTYWSSHHPNEVPLIGGEYAYIAMYDPEYCESSQPAREAA